MFSWNHQVQFYETDLMGIVHHSNYLRFFEIARVQWAHQVGIIDYQKPESGHYLAVIDTNCRHHRPSFFGDILKIELQVRGRGVRIFFEYKITCPARGGEKIASGATSHASLSTDLKPIRLPEPMQKILEKELWTETWL